MEVSHATQPVLLTGLILPIFGHGRGVLYILAQLASLVRLMELHVRKEINTSKQLLEVLEEFIIFFVVKCSGMVERSLKCKFTYYYSVRIKNLYTSTKYTIRKGLFLT